MAETVIEDVGASDLRALARSSTLSLVGTIAKGVLGFALVFVVTRGLGPSGAGLFFQAVALFTILSAVRMGADTGLVRFVSRLIALDRSRDLRRTLAIAVYPVVVITVILGVAVFVFAHPVARLLVGEGGVEQAVTSIRILSVFLPLSAVSDVLVGGTRGFGTVVPYVAVESVGKPILRPVLVLILLAAGASSVGALVGWAVPIALALPFVAVWVGSLLRRAEAGGAEAVAATAGRRLAREFWAFCLPQGAAAFLQNAVRSLDIVLVGALRSPAEAGVYAAVSRTVLYGLFAIDALRIAIAPQISSMLASNDRSRAKSVYQVATWWLVLASWPIYLVLGVFAPVVLRVFGPGFGAGQDALLILSVGMLIATGTGNIATVLLMSGRSGTVLGNAAAALAVNVVLNIVLIPKLGIEGAAIAWLVSIVTGESLALWQSHRHLRIHPFGLGYAVASLGAVGCYAGLGLVVRGLFGASIPATLLSVATATAVFAAILFRCRSLLQLSSLWSVVRVRFPGGRVGSGGRDSGGRG